MGEMGSLVPSSFDDSDLFDHILSVKGSGHDPYAHKSFYEVFDSFIRHTVLN